MSGFDQRRYQRAVYRAGRRRCTHCGRRFFAAGARGCICPLCAAAPPGRATATGPPVAGQDDRVKRLCERAELGLPLFG